MKTAFLFVGMTLLVAGPLAWVRGADVAEESAKANAFFERTFTAYINLHPEEQSSLGIKRDYDKWEDESEAAGVRDLSMTVANLAELKSTINYDLLDRQTQLSYRLFVREGERSIERYRWRLYDYPVNQMHGEHTDTVGFLIGTHRVNDLKDAEAYVARLRGIKARFETLVVNLEKRREAGIIPPKFVFPLVLASSREIISGAPFDDSGKESTLLEDFSKKLDSLKDVDPQSKSRLAVEARDALLTSVKPAYLALIEELKKLETSATTEDGVWKFPHGAEYYDFKLRDTTTTELSAAEIHELGLKEVARIQDEMRAIMQKVGFQGDLVAFFKYLKTNPDFHYPNNAEGKAAFLKRSVEIIDDMRGRLDQLFITKPKAPLEVRAVEAFREKESGGAFYQRGTPDGSRPGRYYVNLYDMNAMPKYELPAFAYHEGIPGHHMQISIAQEIKGLPTFRRVARYTAYIEGWGLYCERLPKEIGLYSDPYEDFGRLSLELRRAARLVVDTGIHAKKWTRQQTMDWLEANTSMPDREILTETNRYIVIPSQATAYKIGMLKFLELRELAKKELEAKFDIREYHEVVLRDGPLPLDVLEDVVREWIAQKKSAI